MKIGLLVIALGLGWLMSGGRATETTHMPADPQERSTLRQTIRNTPLLERPNRPGHFYGNTVRRMNERRAPGG